MADNKKDQLETDLHLKFPVITISISYDDINEPIHVDLGSIPPFVAFSVFQQILDSMREAVVTPKITFAGDTLVDAIPLEDLSNFDLEFDDDYEDEEEDEEIDGED